MVQGIGKEIEKLMIQNGLNQKQLSAASKLTEAAISNYLKGTRQPNKTSLAKIAKALNTTPENLTKTSYSPLGATTALRTLSIALSSAAMLSPALMIAAAIGGAGALTLDELFLGSKEKKKRTGDLDKILLEYKNKLLRFQKISIAAIQTRLTDKKIEFSYNSGKNSQETRNQPDYSVDIYNEKIDSWWFIFYIDSTVIDNDFKVDKKNQAASLISKFALITPSNKRKMSIVINDKGLYDAICSYKGNIAYKGNLSVILIDENEIDIKNEDNIAYYGDENDELLSLI